MKKKGILLSCLCGSILLAFCSAASPVLCAQPVLFFSDLDWGPKTGWEGSVTKGAAVSVWGKNLQSGRGNSYVTVNGISLTQDPDYAEWGAFGPARELERITFWLNPSCQDGPGQITVTVNGVTSNPLQFTVMAGDIYFISASNGNNNYSGRYATHRGGENGPFRDIKMFNPGLNPTGNSASYIVYVRGGTYTEQDRDGAFVALRGPYGSNDSRKALVGYPAETPILQLSGAGRGAVWVAKYAPYGRIDYFTYSKLNCRGGSTALTSWGDQTRITGCTFEDMPNQARSGVVMVDNSEHTKIYGNYWRNCGYDSYKHNIYIKTHRNYITGDKTSQQIDIGWNEFRDAYANDNHGGVVFISTQSYAGSDGKFTNDIRIHDNHFQDGNMEFIYTGDNVDVKDIYIYNNTFKHGTCSRGLYIAWHTKNVYLYNNTFYQIGAASGAMIRITGRSNAVFKNNIWYARPGQSFLRFDSYQGATFESDFDLFYDPDGSTRIPSGGSITVTNATTGDPLLADPANGDFHLQALGPAVDKGTSVVNPVVIRDYEGNMRYGSGTYDVGAFEYPKDADPPMVPQKPSNLRLVTKS